MDYLEQQIRENPERGLRLQAINRQAARFAQQPQRAVNGVITIPVVFHIVYDNASENITDAQVLSQITVLNEDFRRNNADAANTPSDFLSVAADVEIEFCLATVDPNGIATNGITRTATATATPYATRDDVKFTSLGGKDAWPTGDYLNIWVCELGGGTLGYAQFPGGPAATDGVVIDYRYVGSGPPATPPYNLGRTATHEVGHWLNMIHIWGDGDCSVDDLVSDTPLAAAPNYNGSPCTYDGALNSCDEGAGDLPDMFQNYMDYSDDACMNLFTQGQTTRMRALFDVGGFRESLLSSNGCGQPATCDDGVQNGDETGVDCGGSACDPCPCYANALTLTITLDNFPEETSWEIRDASNTVVASGGTYGSEPDGSTIVENINLADGDYTFTIFDTFGDGICCAQGNGSYTLSDGANTIASGGTFGSSESTPFCTGGGTCPDADSDGVCDNDDNCPNNANAGQADADGDNVGDACDNCPNDPNKVEPGICGCGVADTDT
ncbi:MAG: zinc metalloprotease, partial [Phaeodactylibacter sp.]|nr:zinc metalloprotease [Phaeodactylibacter sp.]